MTKRILFTTTVESAASRARKLTPVREHLTAAWRRNPDTGRLEMHWSTHRRPRTRACVFRATSAVDRAVECGHLGAAPEEPGSLAA